MTGSQGSLTTRELYASVFTRHIFPTLGAVALGDLTRDQIRALLADKAAAQLSRATLANLVIPVRAMLNAAVEDGRIPANPAQRLGRFPRGLNTKEAHTVTALTAEELGRILTAADKYAPDTADLFYILGWSGLRLGEACGLQWGDLDPAGGFLEVRRTVAVRGRQDVVGSPKSGQARRVDLPAALVVRLCERRSIREAEAALRGRTLAPWVFPALSDDARPVNAAYVRYKIWYPLLRHAGVRDVRLHDLRHTYASLLLQAGEAPGLREGPARPQLDPGHRGPLRALHPGGQPAGRRAPGTGHHGARRRCGTSTELGRGARQARRGGGRCRVTRRKEMVPPG